MKYTLKNIFLLLQKKPTWQLEEGHIVTPAFISNGVQYYELKNPLSLFTFRGLEAYAVHDEWNCRMTKSILSQFLSTMKNAMSGKEGKVDMNIVYEMVIRMEERMNWVIPTPELIYKMAAIIYFDKNETPYEYDEKYAREKIARWKKEGVSPFFLVRRMPGLIPFQAMSQDVLEAVTPALKTIEQMDNFHQSRLASLLAKHLLKGGSRTTKTPS